MGDEVLDFANEIGATELYRGTPMKICVSCFIFGTVQRDAHENMRFLFYLWSFAKIADIYFVCFYELLKTRDLLILPAGFLTSVDMPWCEGAAALEC